MSILNKKHYYLNTNSVELRNDSSYRQILPLTDGHYWYVEFYDEHSLMFLEQVIPSDVLNSIRNGFIKLCLVNAHEAFNYTVSLVYHYLIKLNIPEDNVLLVYESANISGEISRQAEFYGKKEIKAIWVRIFENAASLKIANNYKINTLTNKKYSKSFLNLNRRSRDHRIMFVALLELFNLRNNGYISFGDNDFSKINWKNYHEYLLELSKDNIKINNLLLENKSKILNIPKMYLDTQDLVTNRAKFDITTDIYYEDSYFSVVSETHFYNTGKYGLMLSEKIFKPIAKRHPFILISLPGSLLALKKLGYKTFEPLIDETYDFEIDDHNRMLKIIKEVKRLSLLSGKELTYFLKKAKTICDYNYNVLKEKTEFFTRCN